MNSSFSNPMLGDTSNMVEVAGAFEITDAFDVMASNPIASFGNANISTDLTTAIESHSFGNKMFKSVGACHYMTDPPPEVRAGRDSTFDDIESIIKRECLKEGQYHEFRMPRYGKTHEMKDNLFIAMPNKDIPIEVLGAQGGHVVKVGMRYTSGVHHDTPVLACRAHDYNDVDGFPFHIPKLQVVKMKDQGHHPMIEISVPHNGLDEGIFTFSVVFWCLNSCHRKYGKGQELILKLCDVHDNVLTEFEVKLRICRNVNRDKNLEGQSPKQEKRKQSSGGKGKGAALKKLKPEVHEGGEGVQAGTSETPAPFHLLPPHLANLQVMCDPVLVPVLREYIKVLNHRVGWIKMKELDRASPDPLPNKE